MNQASGARLEPGALPCLSMPRFLSVRFILALSFNATRSLLEEGIADWSPCTLGLDEIWPVLGVQTDQSYICFVIRLKVPSHEPSRCLVLLHDDFNNFIKTADPHVQVHLCPFVNEAVLTLEPVKASVAIVDNG